jgi:tRNA(fMet)-specific endonuclease VapC
MAARYLLDTNVISHFLENRPPEVRHRLSRAGPDTTAISAITEAELRYGLARKPGAIRQRIPVEKFLADAVILPWDSAAAGTYGFLRAAQERKGKPLSSEDMMIAAHALALGLTLVTHDLAFSFVDGLTTEDWTVALG